MTDNSNGTTPDETPPEQTPAQTPPQQRDGWDDDSTDDPGEAAGEAAGNTLLKPVQVLIRFASAFVYAVTRILPYGRTFWASLLKTSLKNMQKSSGGDIVGIIGRGDGRLEFEPMKFKQFDDEPGSPRRWVAKSGEEWHPGAEGKGWKYVGSTPVALFHETAVPRGSWFQSNYAEALQIGQKEQLVADADVTQEIVLDAGDASDKQDVQQAMADGGVNYADQRFRINDPGLLEDVLVDLDPDDDSQGMRVSTEKYAEVFQEKVGTEEMRMQEARGRAAEVDPESQRDRMFRILKYILGGVVLARSPELLALLMGESGGNLSSVSPILLDVTGAIPI